LGVLVTITGEQEIWAMALWVDREHGEDAERFIGGKGYVSKNWTMMGAEALDRDSST
jgi:hypothetical protein